MTEICYNKAHRYQLIAADQDKIGWRRFMDDMVCRRIRNIQCVYLTVEGSSISPPQWTEGLVIDAVASVDGVIQFATRLVRAPAS
jgi:hypothetical protein